MHRAVRWFGEPYFVKGQNWANENCTTESSTEGSTEGSTLAFELGSGGGLSGSGIQLQSGSGSIPVVPKIIDDKSTVT